MTFEDLITFAFPSGPPEHKRFIVKSGVDTCAIQFLPNQVVDTVFHEQHADIWIYLENVDPDYHDLFDE
jgi:hypothetical protein